MQVDSFETAWSLIGDAYYDATMKGLDWQALHDELLPQARRSRTNAETAAVIARLYEPLGESHFAVVGATSGGAHAELEDILRLVGMRPQSHGDGSLGMYVRPTEAGMVAVRVDPGSPALAAGVVPGTRIRALAGIDLDGVATRVAAAPDLHGLRFMATQIASLAQRAPAGDAVVVEIDTVEGTRSLEVPTARTPAVDSTLPDGRTVPVEVVHWRDDGVGYVRFDAFLAAALPVWSAAIEGLVADDACCVVLDLRGNPGGLALSAAGVAGHLVSSPTVLGRLATRAGTMIVRANPQARRVRFGGRVAVLVDDQSASTAELLAGGLQSEGRARVFGQTTSGLALLSFVAPLPNGDLLQYVIGDLHLADGRRLEAVGLVPDVVTPMVAADGTDPTLQAALDWLRTAPGTPP